MNENNKAITTPPTFVNGVTPLNAENLNKLSTAITETKSQLVEKANGRMFRDVRNNIICGYEGNKVADDLGQCVIAGGGGQGGRENVIGGNLDNVNTQNPNNEPMQTGTGANLSRILGGYDNVINGLSSQIISDHCKIGNKATHCSIIGGANHWIKDNSDFTSINGGINNTIDGSYSVINGGSGNTITGQNSVINGGSGNIADGQGATVVGGASGHAIGNYSTIGGGSSNKNNGTSTTIAGGQNNANTKNYGTIGGGFENKVNGEYATIIGGAYNQADGYYSDVRGLDGLSKYKGESVHSSGKLFNKGDCQTSDIVLGKQTTNATKTWITITGTTNTLNIPENGTWHFNCVIVGRKIGGGENASFEIKGMAQRSGSGSATFVGTPAITELFKSNGLTWRIETACMGNGFYIYVYGEESKTINWVGDLHIVQIVG